MGTARFRAELIARPCGQGQAGPILVSPKPLEPILRQRSVPRGVLDVSVSKVGLQGAGIMSVVGELVTTSVAKHVAWAVAMKKIFVAMAVAFASTTGMAVKLRRSRHEQDIKAH
jgi:hypothetical protein